MQCTNVPFESKKQQRWAYGPGGKKAGFTDKKLKEWSGKTDFDSLPEESAQSMPLTPEDETYRGLNYPLATVLNWGDGPVNLGIFAELNWSTHKPETFKDTGEKGLHPAWGLKSVIDRGVKTHEKPNGDKRIGEGEHQTQKRSVDSKSFKSYSMVHAFDWAAARPCGEGENPERGKCNPNLSPNDWELQPGGEDESMLHLMESPSQERVLPQKPKKRPEPEYYPRTLMGTLNWSLADLPFPGAAPPFGSKDKDNEGENEESDEYCPSIWQNSCIGWSLAMATVGTTTTRMYRSL